MRARLLLLFWLLHSSPPGLSAEAPGLSAEAPGLSDPQTISPGAIEMLQALRFPAERPVDFAQRQSSPMFKRTVSSHGRVWREAAGALLMQVDTPIRELRRIDGNVLTIWRSSTAPGATEPLPPSAFDRLRHQVTLDEDRAGDLLLLAASALLNGNFQWLESQFSGEVSGSPGTVELRPKRKALRQSMPRLTLTIADNQLRRLSADRGRRGAQHLDLRPLAP